jgi:hypothetical protein
MDYSFASAINRMRAIIHRYDPQTPVGIAGVQMPSAWGGFDLWQLSQSVDWMEPYDIANSRAILGSFLPRRAPVLATYFGNDAAKLRRQAWSRLLDGDRGAIVWDDSDSRVVAHYAAATITPRGEAIRELFRELRSAAGMLAGLRREDDRVAIHYSQPSIRVHWMFDSREDGDTWPKRFSSYEAGHSRLAKVRNTFVQILEGLGITPAFLSSEQIEAGELTRGGYRILLLPQSVAMSARECRAVEDFVRGGGVVVADNMAATMDEHGRRLQGGQLDELFGVRQKPVWQGESHSPLSLSALGLAPFTTYDPSLTIVAPARRDTVSGAPMVVAKRTGAGRTYFLNIDMREADSTRASRFGNYVKLFESLLPAAGAESPIRVPGRHDLTIVRFAGSGIEYVAIYPAAAGPSASRIHVILATPANVRMSGKDLGSVRELDVVLDPARPLFLELRPERNFR